MLMKSAVAAAAMLVCGSSYGASTGVPSLPWAGDDCIKFAIGWETYAFLRSDRDALQLLALNNAALVSRSVTVYVASEVDPTLKGLDTVYCDIRPDNKDAIDHPFKRPWLVIP